jgi:ribonucleoside-diphosphate reductase alpha chain
LIDGYIWATPMTLQFMGRDYLLPGQTLDERVRIIAHTAQSALGIPGYADKFIDYMKKGFFSLSTPIWSNYGTDRGLPISCFGSNVEDDMASILYTQAEVGMMSKYGGGTSVYLGNLRGRGTKIRNNGESSGAVHFVQLFDAVTSVVSQGGVRRGNCAVYLDVDHPDINEWLTMRSEGSPIQDISFGICVPDYWMQEMIDGDKEKRKVWAKVLDVRSRTGYPYIFFADNANKTSPYADIRWNTPGYGDRTHVITHSNLCSEIMLPDSKDEAFVCDLASMNVLHFDEWKDTDAVETLTFLLDAVMSEFIDKASKILFMDRAVRFARRHRALGIGWLGWHSYLQEKMLAWDSFEAKMLNVQVAKTIHDHAYAASAKLAELFGEPEVLKSVGRRNTTLCAIAPTKSSAFILGQVSEGIEPHHSNYVIKDLAKGKFTIKNRALQNLLSDCRQDTDEVWESIMKKGGSVQHLDFLSDHEKNVFKTFSEISPKEIIIQAAARQNFIDQGQSLNLMIGPGIPTKDVNALYVFAWEQGIKSLYYQFSVNAAQQFARNILECGSCSA